MEALLNKAKYYWGYYRQGKQIDNLTAAASFLREYREKGGDKAKDLSYLIYREIDILADNKESEPVITKEGKEWIATKYGIEGRGRTKIKALANLEETERFIRIAEGMR